MQFLLNSSQRIDEAHKMKRHIKTKKKIADRDYKPVVPIEKPIPVAPLGHNRKGVCHRTLHKIQFIRYQTGMRIFINETFNEYRMITCHGFMLMVLTLFLFFAFFLESSYQVSYLKSQVYTKSDPLTKVEVPISD